MAVTVSSILGRPYMGHVEVLAGKHGLARPLDGVAVMEPDQQPGPGTKNMLVIATTLLLGADPGLPLDKLVAAYAKAKAAGLCLKLSPAQREELPKAMLFAADRYRLPVICLPPDAGLSAVIRGVTYEVLKQNGYDLSISYEDNVVQELIFTESDENTVIKRAAMLGIKVNELLGLLLVQPLGGAEPVAVMEHCRQVFGEGCFSASKNGRVLLVLRMKPPYDTMPARLLDHAGRLQEELRAAFPSARFQIGVGHCYQDVFRLRKSYYEARVALIAGGVNRAGRDVYLYDQMGVYRILFNLKNRSALYEFRDETVSVLRQHDEEHGTSFLPTVREYFDQFYSIQATAKAMYVHYNTIRYRISKIKTLFGWDLLDQNDCVNLYISLKIDEFLDQEQRF